MLIVSVPTSALGFPSVDVETFPPAYYQQVSSASHFLLINLTTLTGAATTRPLLLGGEE